MFKEGLNLQKCSPVEVQIAENVAGGTHLPCVHEHNNHLAFVLVKVDV
jgi:hypothetical protein